MKGLAATSEESCGHRADLRNIPTVQLGESLTSLYISDNQPGSSARISRSTRASNASSQDGTADTGVKSSSSRKGKEKESSSSSQVGEGEGQAQASGGRPTSTRRREPSNTSIDTAKADGGSETASMTPSTPPSTSSGNSYSAEMHDLLTPLRDAFAPSTSKRRSVATMGTAFEPPSTTTPTQPVAGGSSSPGGSAYQYQGGHVVTATHALASATRVANSPSMGLSEILATPSYRELNASRDSEYTTSPFERYSSSPNVVNPRDGGSREIDYFNLPLSYREGSVSAHQTPESLQSRRSGNEPPRPQSEPLPEDSSTPSWSSSDITSLTQSSSLKSPRIRNEGMLAPHGSFTSESGRRYQAEARLRRAESLSKESVSSNDNDSDVQSWRSRTASERSLDAAGRRKVSEEQYRQYVKDAMNGDQLALYHLGWAPNRAHDRHSLGDAELVWGGAVEPTSPGAFSSRSSATSRPSLRSNSTSYARSHSSRTGPQEDQAALHRNRSRQDSVGSNNERPQIRSRQSTYDSDLFSDVARMTLQSNAKNNRAGQATPPPTPSPMDPPRTAPPPTVTRRTSSDVKPASGSRTKEPGIEKSARPPSASASASVRSKDPLKDKERDPVREQERKEERERRRAARRKGDSHSSASGSTQRDRKSTQTT